MSLDVYLIMEGANIAQYSSGIFIREGGQTKEISQDEWDKKFPDRQAVKVVQDDSIFSDEVFSANITHNLNKMADEAGIYEALWRPEEIGITNAKQLAPILALGWFQLEHDPDRFKKFNPENGWGNYEGLVNFVEKYLNACIEYPNANVTVSR